MRFSGAGAFPQAPPNRAAFPAQLLIRPNSIRIAADFPAPLVPAKAVQHYTFLAKSGIFCQKSDFFETFY
jgi:hypothetical protein